MHAFLPDGLCGAVVELAELGPPSLPLRDTWRPQEWLLRALWACDLHMTVASDFKMRASSVKEIRRSSDSFETEVEINHGCPVLRVGSVSCCGWQAYVLMRKFDWWSCT